MNMEQMKRAMISTFGNIGKRNRRLVCIVMTGIMLVTQTDLPRVFAEAGEEVNEAESAAGGTATGDDADQAADTVLITGFEELPAEIAEQTAAPGTPYEELILPAELTAYIGNEADHSGENDEEDEAEENTGKEDDADDNSGEAGDGTEDNSGEVGGDTEDNSGEAGDDAEDNDGAEGDSPEDSDSTDGNGTDDNDSTDGDGADEDSAGDNGNTDENAPEDGSTEGEEPENSATADDAETAAANAEGDGNDSGVKQDHAEHSDGYTAEAAQYEAHTTTVALQAYQSENILTLETLEQNVETAEDSPEVTDTKTSEGIPEPSDEPGQTAVVIPDITWESAPVYDSDIQGEYIFTPVLPEGYCVGDEVALPMIIVTVEQRGTVRRMVAAGTLRAGGHSHPLCGTNCTHSHGNQSYTAFNGTGGSLSAGSYYLGGNLEFTTALEISGTVNLCLNGHSIYSEVSDGVIRVHNNSVLNICDCGNGGKIYCLQGHNPIQLSSGGTLNLYGGTIESGGATAIPVGTGTSDSSGGCTINIYGGTVSGKGQAILINPGMSGTTVNVYGGNVTAANYGIRVRNGSVNLAGGNVTATGSTGIGISAEDGTGVTMSGNAAVSGTAADISTALPIQDNGYTGGNVSIKVTNSTLFVVNTVLVQNGAVNSGKYSLVKEHTDNGWGLLKGGSGSQDLVLHTHLSHTYAAPVWNWTGYTSASAEFSCTVAGCGYKETVTTAAGGITSTVTKEATCTQKGSKTYTASVVFEGKTYTDTKTEEISIKPFTVTFDANGGTGSMGSQTFTYGTAQALSMNQFTRNGYAFNGWNTKKTGGGDAFADGASLVNYAPASGTSVILYAQWKIVNYKITYILDDGEVAGNPNDYSVESAAIVLKNPIKEGFTFTGWSGTGLNGDKNMIVTIAAGSTGNREYTAHWKAEGYTVTLHGNGGSGTALTGYTYGTGATLPANWTRTGYTFAGWYENEECTGTAAVRIADTDMGDKEYWAKWSPKQYTVTFAYQGATGGDGTASISVTYDSAYGTLPQPEKDGYAFQGWYTQADGQGSQIVSTTKVTTDADHVLYAFWKDSEAPDAPALQSGVTIPADWTNAQSTIPLVLTDNVGVTKLWVKVDDGGFVPAEGFAGSGASTQYVYTVLEGSHTYAFKAADAVGNESGISVFTVKLDTAKPVLGPLSYENKAATLWQWIIGKKSMIIHVPVSDDGSGVTQIRYVMTPADADGSYDDSRKEEKTAAVVDGQAKITFPQEEAYQGFRGRIVITCTDLAGNAADSVTVGMTEGMNGVLVEDIAPVITAMADRRPTDMTAAQPGGTDVSEDYYETAPALMVTVSDDTDHQIAAGIASVTYQVGDTPAQSVAVGTDTMQSRIQFTVPASGIPTGVTAIRVTARDHAGNEAAETYTVRVKGPERKPAAVTDYRAEKLTGFVPNAKYSINGVPYTADEQGSVPVEEAWMGTTLAIVKCGNGNETLDSEAQSLTIPVRPQTPAPAAQDETGPNRKDGRLTGLTGNTAYEISVDGGRTWESRTADADGAIAGLAPDSYVVRAAATDVSFASRVSESPAVIKAYRISVVFMANGEAYTTLYTSYGESITQIPEVPAKKDAGERLYEGAWCDAQGSPAVFTNIQADMTVYAVYTPLYTVTLQEGRGYTLTAASGSLSPVKEGGSYGFTFALQKGYRTNAKFAVKVNGVAAEPTEDGSYVMEDIRENKTVTVEGVVKKTSGSKPGGGDPSGDGGQSDGGNGSGDNGQPGGGNPSGDSSQPGGGNPSGDNGQPGGGNPSGDNGQPDGKKPPEDEAPMTGTRPSGTGTPPAGRTPSDQDGSDGTAPTGTDSGNPSEDDGDVTDTTPENVEAQGTSPTDTEPTTGTEPEGEIVQTLSAAIDGGRIVLTDDNAVDGGSAAAGGNIATGNVNGMPGTSTVLELGEGAVVVKVICTEQNCSAGVEDTVAVANAVLTQTHMELVSNGEVIEIRIDVKDISSQVPEQDQEVIESGIQAYEREIPGLKLGMYVDISMFIRSGQADWQAVTETVEPVAAVIGIPSGLQEDGREYYIIRAHEGEYTLLRDTDEAPDTITISTDRFSSYAIAWQESGAAGSRCGLCHICPTFLGICCFVWLAVIAAAAFAVLVIMLRRRKSAE